MDTPLIIAELRYCHRENYPTPADKEGVSVIEKLALKTAVFFSNNRIIDSDDVEACAFGLEILFSTVINFAVVLAVAVLTREFLAFAVFFASFIPFRLNAGGFHAKTHTGCTAVLVAALLLYIAALRFMPATAKTISAAISLIISIIIIFKFAPVEHPNNPLSNKSRHKLRKRSIILLCIWSALCILLFFIRPGLAFYTVSGVSLSAASMLAEKIKVSLMREK